MGLSIETKSNIRMQVESKTELVLDSITLRETTFFKNGEKYDFTSAIIGETYIAKTIAIPTEVIDTTKTDVKTNRKGRVVSKGPERPVQSQTLEPLWDDAKLPEIRIDGREAAKDLGARKDPKAELKQEIQAQDLGQEESEAIAQELTDTQEAAPQAELTREPQQHIAAETDLSQYTMPAAIIVGAEIAMAEALTPQQDFNAPLEIMMADRATQMDPGFQELIEKLNASIMGEIEQNTQISDSLQAMGEMIKQIVRDNPAIDDRIIIDPLIASEITAENIGKEEEPVELPDAPASEQAPAAPAMMMAA